MEFMIVCSKGLEKTVVWEAQGFGLKLVEKSNYIVILKGNLDNFIKFSYFTQSAKNCLIYNGRYDNVETIKNEDSKLNLNKKILDLIADNESFKVKIEIPDKEKKELCQPLAIKYGEIILDKAKDVNKSIKVEMKKPDKIIYGLYNNEYLYIGSLINKKPLDTRDYRLFLTNTSLKSNIAFWSWSNIANELKKDYIKFKKLLENSKIIDISCSTGEIGIEGTLFLNNISHNKFRSREIFLKWYKSLLLEYEEDFINNNITLSDESLKELNFAKKNAKVIEVNNMINFTRTQIDYLDVKFNEDDIDVVNSNLFQPGPYEKPSKYKERYKELFYQIDYIVKKSGIISFVFIKKELIDILKEYAKEYKFKNISSYESYLGQQKYYQFIFRR